MTVAIATTTTILHSALAELGSNDRPSSIDDTSSNVARRAKSLWPDVIRPLLAAHPWNFAIKRVALNRSSVIPSFGYTARYQLPTDCLRWLPADPASRDYALTEREGDTLLTNAEAPLVCRYIALIEDVTQWSPWFVKAVTLELAASMAEGVTQSEGIKDRLVGRAEKALIKAKRMDGLETGQTQRGGAIVRSDWLTARNHANFGRYR